MPLLHRSWNILFQVLRNPKMPQLLLVELLVICNWYQ
jgi:hypothetical protein